MSTDPRLPLGLAGDNSPKGRAKARRTRSVFHAALAAELNDRGMASIDELYLRLDWFLLPLTKGEIEQIVESARRHGLVREAPRGLDAYGCLASRQWMTTGAGRKLGRPRALALPDLGHRLLGDHEAIAKLFDAAKTVAVGVVPVLVLLLGIKVFDAGSLGTVATAGAVGVVIASVFVYGINGELNLRCAAEAWPRFRKERHGRYRYQRSWVCSLYLPVVVAMASMTIGLGFVSGHFEVPLDVCVAEALLIVGLYISVVRPMRGLWQGDRATCHDEWCSRG